MKKYININVRFDKLLDKDILKFLDKEEINKSCLIRAGLRILNNKYGCSNYKEIRKDLIKQNLLKVGDKRK